MGSMTSIGGGINGQHMHHTMSGNYINTNSPALLNVIQSVSNVSSNDLKTYDWKIAAENGHGHGNQHVHNKTQL